MMKHLLIAATGVVFATVAYAQDADTVETMASADEVQKVNDELAKINCKAPEVEKESPRLFEVDDASCDIGQYDIKLNANYKIWVMTLDE